MAADLGVMKCMTRSGKTMRFIPGQATRGNMSAFTGQYGLVKETIGTFSTTHALDFGKLVQDGGLQSDLERRDFFSHTPVIYSLNKRKRWLLPAMIAEGIADKDFHEECNYRVVMEERDISSCKGANDLKRTKASYKAIHRSKSEGKSCRRAKMIYSHQRDLGRNPEALVNRRKERAERRKERARTGKRIPVTPKHQRVLDPEPRLPELRYEVLRPTPLHHYTMHMNQKPIYDNDSPRKGNRRRDTCTFQECQQDSDLYDNVHLDLDLTEDWPLHTVHDDDGCVKRLEDSTPFDLGSYLTSRSQMTSSQRDRLETHEKNAIQDKCSSAMTSPMRKRYGKGCSVYRPDLAATSDPEKPDSKSDFSDVDTLDSGFESDGSSTVHDDYTVSWIDLSSVAKECVHPDRLRMDFGQDYVEGRSVPRRFSINIKAVSPNQIPVAASAVFTIEDVRQHPDLVKLRLRCGSADFPVQDLHSVIKEGIASTPQGMVSLIDELKEILTSHSSSSENLESNVSKSKRPDVTLETVQCMMGWNFTYNTIEHVKAQLDEEEIECEQHLNGTTNDFSESGISQESEDSCGICFESLAPSGGEDEEMGTALHGCGHLFCKECWVHHVTNRVLMNETKIHCPAYKCESIMDKTTLLSLLPDTLTHIHLNRLHSNRINAHPQWRWCPNPKCGRLVRIQEEKETGLELGLEVSQKVLGVPVPCECGVLWCSECHEEAHWPATCKQAALHLTHMKDIGLDSIKKSEKITSVEVKRCPSCRNPMEKNGGCMHMLCNCGFDFCWECLAAWTDHDWTTWEFKCPQPKENLETVFLSGRRHQSISFTELAIENRKMRSHHIITKHHEAALKLARRMFFVPETATTYLHLSEDDLFPACIRMPQGPMAWSYSSNHADQSRLITLVARATKMAAFAAEVRILLEYMSILIAFAPRGMRQRRSGWKAMILRLMFIACRMEELLESQHDRVAEDVWSSLRVLLHQGQLCLKDITRTVPLLHQGLQDVKGQGSKVTAGKV